jgi:pimeloyl-ACP methyl ester carboxylesterase
MPLASSPTELPPRFFEAADGARLAWQELGEGRPVVLIHGLFSNAWTNWVRYGHAARIAGAGFRVSMPELRAHGASAAPHAAEAYPPDVLAADGEALLRHLGLADYDLGGYSLGGRTAVRMVVRGARPRRLVVAGMGLQGLHDTGARARHFRAILEGLGSHPRGSPEWMAEMFLKTTGGDARALLPLLNSFVDTTEAELQRLDMPALAIAGVEDHDNGSAAELARTLADARLAEVPGGHMTAVLKPELGEEIARFLGG